MVLTINNPYGLINYFKAISNAKMGLNLSRGTPIKYYSSDRLSSNNWEWVSDVNRSKNSL